MINVLKKKQERIESDGWYFTQGGQRAPSEKKTFDQRPGWSKGVMSLFEETVFLGEENTQGKGPKVGTRCRLEGWNVLRDRESTGRWSQKVSEQLPKATLSQVTVTITKQSHTFPKVRQVLPLGENHSHQLLRSNWSLCSSDFWNRMLNWTFPGFPELLLGPKQKTKVANYPTA